MITDFENKVSIIVPVYNVEKYVGQCLDSLLNQTFKEFEIICIDDGSTDQSLQILEYYEKRDFRIIVVNQNNKGAGAARNFGLQFAKGKYIFFLDADDFFEPKMLETCVKAMDEEQSDIVIYRAQKYDQQTGKVSVIPDGEKAACCPNYSPFSPHEVSKYLYNICRIAPWNMMFRHSFVRNKALKFQEIARSNDAAFYFQALAQAEKISILKQIFVNYRVNMGNSLQQTTDKSPLLFWDSLTEAKRRLLVAGLYNEYEQSFLNCALKSINVNLNNLRRIESRKLVISHIKKYGEKDFGFLNHPFSYYYLPHLIIKYYLLIHLPFPSQLFMFIRWIGKTRKLIKNNK